MDVNMLKEPDVINAVCTRLEKAGYKINHKSMPNEHGNDIVAKKEGVNKRLVIEAKGATTSKDTSRKGQSFDAAQIRVHVSEAFYKAAHEIPNIKVNGEDIYSCIALPATRTHQRLIRKFDFIEKQIY